MLKHARILLKKTVTLHKAIVPKAWARLFSTVRNSITNSRVDRNIKLNLTTSSASKPTSPHFFPHARQLRHTALRQRYVNVVATRARARTGSGTSIRRRRGVPLDHSDRHQRTVHGLYSSRRPPTPSVRRALAAPSRRRFESPSHDPRDEHQHLTRESANLRPLIADTDDGTLHGDQQSSSIDETLQLPVRMRDRLESQEGKRARMLKNPSYSESPPILELNRRHLLETRGLSRHSQSGKGQPQQVMGTGHGAAPARFRNIKVGSAYKGA